MWANVVESNNMIGTHVDAVLANALERGFKQFDVSQAWAGVKKNAYVPPERDYKLLYYDREPYTPDEVRAGLSSQELLNRSLSNYKSIYNSRTGFMEARNMNGTWAGRLQGWAEGDDWIYTFNVMQDPKGLAELMGGADKMKAKLDKYFEGGHNDQSNEPSHHAPYMYSAIGYPASTQNLTRFIAYTNYNATAAGLSGNEDLGQMSAWYVYR